jgi:hypothetical protein
MKLKNINNLSALLSSIIQQYEVRSPGSASRPKGSPLRKIPSLPETESAPLTPSDGRDATKSEDEGCSSEHTAGPETDCSSEEGSNSEGVKTPLFDLFQSFSDPRNASDDDGDAPPFSAATIDSILESASMWLVGFHGEL